MSNTKTTNLNNKSNSSEKDPLLNAASRDKIYNNALNKKATEATWFKSFDFSNTAIYAKNDYDKASSLIKSEDNAFFRRFHQMTIYVQKPHVYSHGSFKTDHKYLVITSNLPESFSYSFGGDWVTPFNFGNPTMNAIMQVFGKEAGFASGVSRATTLRIWNGSKPLSLNLTIPVIDDGYESEKDNGSGTGTNLVEALEMLGSLALPRYIGSTGATYVPPPSPIGINIKYKNKDKVKATGANGEAIDWETENTGWSSSNPSRIMLQLGGMLLIDHCIIENVDVKYPNTKAMIRHDYTANEENFGNTGGFYLHPLLAEVTLRISTAEALTANNYSKMLWAKEDAQYAGKVTADFTSDGFLDNTVSEGITAVKRNK